MYVCTENQLEKKQSQMLTLHCCTHSATWHFCIHWQNLVSSEKKKFILCLFEHLNILQTRPTLSRCFPYNQLVLIGRSIPMWFDMLNLFILSTSVNITVLCLAASLIPIPPISCHFHQWKQRWRSGRVQRSRPSKRQRLISYSLFGSFFVKWETEKVWPFYIHNTVFLDLFLCLDSEKTPEFFFAT
jgi:hypothetical protein